MTKTARSVILITLLLLFSFLEAQQSRDMAPSRRQNMFGRNLLAYQAYNFADSTSADGSCMEFHIAVVNDLLTFIRAEDGRFRARYEISVIIYNDRKEVLVERSLSNRVVVSTFEETNLRSNPSMHNIAITLPAGRYSGLLKLSDIESSENLTEELQLTFRNFSRDRLHLSDIMFLDRIDSTATERRYLPNVRNLFDDVTSAFAAYVELYPPEGAAQVDVTLSIVSKGQKLFEGARSYRAPQKAVSLIVPFREHLSRPGEYYLLVNATAGTQSVKVQRIFNVSWANIPLKENNLDIAFEQLAVIANKRTIDSMRQADEAGKKQLYDQFWRQRDPTPNTERNELKEEYFDRIDFCNQNFTELSSGRQGWQTDRGRIYLIYGPPNSVDRQEAELNVSASEIWYYNRLNRKYYFADRGGDGVFRLIKVE